MFFWARLFENIKHNQQEDINTSKKRVIKSPGTAEMARPGLCAAAGAIKLSYADIIHCFYLKHCFCKPASPPSTAYTAETRDNDLGRFRTDF